MGLTISKKQHIFDRVIVCSHEIHYGDSTTKKYYLTRYNGYVKNVELFEQHFFLRKLFLSNPRQKSRGAVR